MAIFTDGQYQIAVEKADAMKAYIQACSGCKVLSYQDSPIAEADQRMPGLISNLLQQNGTKLTYLLAINGNYFGGAQSALRDAGKTRPVRPSRWRRATVTQPSSSASVRWTTRPPRSPSR